MTKGYVVNNTHSTKHAYKRTVYPGQRVPLDHIRSVISKKIPDKDFIAWLRDNMLPSGWEIILEEEDSKQKSGVEGMYKETLLAEPEVHKGPVDLNTYYKEDESSEEEGSSPVAYKYMPPHKLRDLTWKEIANLKTKDDPRRVLKSVDSIHKLRRALTACRNAKGKKNLSRLIQNRIKELTAKK